jgi:hypothetical protein
MLCGARRARGGGGNSSGSADHTSSSVAGSSTGVGVGVLTDAEGMLKVRATHVLLQVTPSSSAGGIAAGMATKVRGRGSRYFSCIAFVVLSTTCLFFLFFIAFPNHSFTH